jgi:hypothetical protein
MDRRVENLERESGWQREQIRSIKDDLGVIKTMLVQARWFVTGAVFIYIADRSGLLAALTMGA